MSKYNQIYNYDTEQNNPLVEGENLIWNGKPKKSAFFFNQVLTMMPIALIWLLFDSFFIIMLIKSGEVREMLYFVIPFFAIHLMPVWIWLGNILSANKRWENTRYFITDKRIIIQNGFIAENHQTIYYKDIENVFLRRGIIDKLLKVGDIYFDTKKKTGVAFLDVEKPDEIYKRIQKIVLDIQTDIEYPNALRPDNNPGYKTKYDERI